MLRPDEVAEIALRGMAARCREFVYNQDARLVWAKILDAGADAIVEAREAE